MPHPSRPATLIGSLALGSLALLIVGTQPILLGALVDAHLVNLENVGLLAMGEIVSLGVGVLFGARLPLQRFRDTVVAAALVAGALDAATPMGRDVADLLALRCLAGLAEGIMIWATTSILVRSRSPERLASIFMVSQAIVQAMFAALLAHGVLPRFGWAGGFRALGAMTLVAAVLACTQPKRLAALQVAGGPVLARWSASTVRPLAIVFLQLAAIGALWAYLEPLGQAIGLDAQAAQGMVSAVLCAQTAGGCVGALLARRLDSTVALVVGTLALTAIALGVHRLGSGGLPLFTLLTLAFGFFWVGSSPFQVGLAFEADPSGQVATLVPALQLLGSAFGPLVASLSVQGNDPRPAALASAAFGMLATALLMAPARRGRYAQRAA